MKKLIFFALVIFASCGSSPEQPATPANPYRVMSVAFEGSPDEAKIKTLVEAVEDKYNLPKTDDEAMHVGNVLVTLRQASKVGVSEMEILKHIYQHGDSKISFTDQAAASSVVLETSK